MWGWDSIRWVGRKIGKTVRNYSPSKNKRSTLDQVQKIRHVFWACAGELSREIAWRYAPGCIGSTLAYKSLKGSQSGGSSSVEQEISSLNEERREWQQERIMLMASTLALAAGANLRPPRN